MLAIIAFIVVGSATILIGLIAGNSPCPPWDDDLLEDYDAMPGLAR